MKVKKAIDRRKVSKTLGEINSAGNISNNP